jgi:ComF family protein
MRCGYPTLIQTDACGSCDQNPPPWQRLIRLSEYRFPMTHLISQFKRNRDIQLGQSLSLCLAEAITDPADLMISVPTTWQKRLQRGFNQSAEMAHILAKHHNKPCETTLFKCRRTGKNQKELNRQQRADNARAAFYVNPKWKGILPKHIALIDDIVTTGQTLAILTEILLQQEVEQVDIYCLAVTPLK